MSTNSEHDLKGNLRAEQTGLDWPTSKEGFVSMLEYKTTTRASNIKNSHENNQ